jgi:hypothetical protein
MQMPCYITIEQARAVLAEMGVAVSVAQIRRASHLDASGKRRLPFLSIPSMAG